MKIWNVHPVRHERPGSYLVPDLLNGNHAAVVVTGSGPAQLFGLSHRFWKVDACEPGAHL